MSKRMKLSVDIPKDWEDHQLLYVMLVKKDENGKLIDALKVPAEIESTEEINGDIAPGVSEGEIREITWREHMGGPIRNRRVR